MEKTLFQIKFSDAKKYKSEKEFTFMKVKRIYDLSAPLKTHMPVWPTSPLPVISPVGIAARDGYNVESLSFLTHTGTHIDAPYHFIENGVTVDRIPLETLISQGYCIRPNISGVEITRSELERKWKSEYDGKTLLIHTGWSKKRSFTREFLYNFPGLSDDAAEFILERGTKVVGIDTLGIEPFSHTDFRVHKKLLSRGVVFIEDLWGLEQLSEGVPYLVVALPVKIEGASGAMARVVALEVEW